MSALYISISRTRAVPIDVLLASIPSLPRHALDRLVEQAIDRMDEYDGDADLEPSGDEQDGDNGEDEELYRTLRLNSAGPGCPIADPDKGADDDGELTEEREPEEYEGGLGDGRFVYGQNAHPMVTA